MSNQSANNKRIAKNTLLLYVRMLFTMGVSLFTSRVVLQTLGVEDYGIYNVVGGIITLFSFVNSGMVSATQRFLTFELGKANSLELQKVFSTALQIHALIALIVVLLGETIGLWFLYEKLVIPVDRMTAAGWVYQCSIVACVVNIMSIPYNADIIAHEKMSAFAYISVLEVSLKLITVYLLYLISWDKLIVYAILLLCVQLLIRFVYARYCSKHFKESHYYHKVDKPLFKEMLSFAGWSFTTSIAYVLSSQGLNMMLNIFFGPAINAARAIAVQIQGTVRQFVNSIQMAINPQITKSYASSQLEVMHSLMSRCARFSYFLLLLMSLPILIETEYILMVWLGEVPENTVIFTRLILMLTLLYPFSNPLIIANQATGKVKKFELYSGFLLLTLLPLSYFALMLDAPAYIVFIIHIILELFTLISRMLLIRKDINLSIAYWLKSAVIPAIIVTIIAFVPPMIVFNYVPKDIGGFLCVCSVSVISVVSFVSLFGITYNERKIIIEKIVSVVIKIIK